MKLIDEKEVEEAKFKRYGNSPHSFGGQRDGFIEGAAFAEQKLLPMMIELLDFAFMNYDDMPTIPEPRYMDINTHQRITTEQLFEQFIKTKQK